MVHDGGIAVQEVARAVGPGLGSEVIRGSAQVQQHAVPGTDSPCVWVVRGANLDHPLQAFVGRWPDGTVRVLSDDPAAWMELMDAVGVRLDDELSALAYVRAFVEVTRGPSVIVHEVAGPDDLRWRPGSPAEERRREAYLASETFPAAVAERVGDGFHVELTLVVDQRVQRNFFEVRPDGQVTASYRVLADDLPLPIAR